MAGSSYSRLRNAPKPKYDEEIAEALKKFLSNNPHTRHTQLITLGSYDPVTVNFTLGTLIGKRIIAKHRTGKTGVVTYTLNTNT